MKKFSLPKDGGLIETELPNGVKHTYERIPAHIYEDEELACERLAEKLVEYIDGNNLSLLEGIVEQQRRWNREKNIKTAESKQKVIDRIEKTMVAPEKTLDSVAFRLPVPDECAKDILSCTNLSKSFDRPIFSDINIEIKNGEKVFLMGANGTGKTTILKIINQIIDADAGTMKLGTNITIGKLITIGRINITINR